MKAYCTLGQRASAEFVEKKSRFIGHACPVETEEEALAFLESIRRDHRDATHNCYAYTVGQNMGIMRYSDDGEPGGTAGLPMMDVLKKRDVRNCCVVVTRYFGGGCWAPAVWCVPTPTALPSPWTPRGWW